MLSAKQARDIGLVADAVPPAELDRAVRAAINGRRQESGATWPVAFAELATFFKSNRVEDVRLGKADTRDKEQLVKAVKKVANKAPIALRIAEQLIDQSSRSTLEEGLRMELEHLSEIFGTEDAYEGLSSLGKKKPVFKGR